MDSLDATFLEGLNRDRNTSFYPGLTVVDNGFAHGGNSFFKAVPVVEKTDALSQFSVLSGKDDPRLNSADSGQSEISFSVTTASNLLLRKNGVDGTQFTEAGNQEIHAKDSLLVYESEVSPKTDAISFDSLFANASDTADDSKDLFSDFSRNVLSNDASGPGKLDYYFIQPPVENRQFGIRQKNNRGF